MNRLSVSGVALIAGAVGLFVPGCLIHSDDHESFSGRYVSENSLRNIEPGSTRRDFVLATLGEPTARTPLDAGGEIWRWDYTRSKSSEGSVFLLFHGDSDSTTQHHVYVSFKTDGTVDKVWRD